MDAGHQVVVLSRAPYQLKYLPDPNLKAELWDGKNIDRWAGQLLDADAVVNLAGVGIADKRWSTERKLLLKSSRIDATRALVNAIGRNMSNRAVFVSGSAVGYYGSVPEGDVWEDSPMGRGFLAGLCSDWEHEAQRAAAMGTRVVLLRTGIVIDKDGGALKKLLTPFRFYLGGPLGSGRQWFPWVHREDVVDAILYIIQNKSLAGPVNMTAPEPLTMDQFCRVLGKAMKRPCWARVPSFMLKVLLGEMSEMLLTGQKVLPQKLVQAGYRFRHPFAEEALEQILK